MSFCKQEDRNNRKMAKCQDHSQMIVSTGNIKWTQGSEQIDKWQMQKCAWKCFIDLPWERQFRKAWEKNKEDYVLSLLWVCARMCMWNNTSFQILHKKLEFQSKEHFFYYVLLSPIRHLVIILSVSRKIKTLLSQGLLGFNRTCLMSV